MASYTGKCHCGALGFSFETARAPGLWSIRACQCAFCRAHGTINTSDPSGSVRFVHKDPSQLQRYRFGTRTADFLICRNCGVYIGAVIDTPAGKFTTINANLFVEPKPQLAPAAPFDYDNETADARIARRIERWTPVVE
jgi:hypothetical protein